jgi:hypothetical protein
MKELSCDPKPEEAGSCQEFLFMGNTLSCGMVGIRDGGKRTMAMEENE